MKKYAYTIIVGDHESTVYSVAAATVFANKQIGCELISTNMIFNYFSRPHVASKKIFGSLVKLSRAEVIRDRSSPPAESSSS